MDLGVTRAKYDANTGHKKAYQFCMKQRLQFNSYKDGNDASLLGYIPQM
jgi:hypothetical protein